jgi:serine/threonine protein kinase
LQATALQLSTSDFMQMLESLQRARIIHTDIKPDNFLVLWPEALFDDSAAPPPWREGTREPAWAQGCVQLIDFGRAIDLALLEPGVQFVGSALTEGMQCPEMLAGKPWHYCVRFTCQSALCYFGTMCKLQARCIGL